MVFGEEDKASKTKHSGTTQITRRVVLEDVDEGWAMLNASCAFVCCGVQGDMHDGKEATKQGTMRNGFN